jgi:hypothetical protein
MAANCRLQVDDFCHLRPLREDAFMELAEFVAAQSEVITDYIHIDGFGFQHSLHIALNHF